jgi:hypothetical protein
MFMTAIQMHTKPTINKSTTPCSPIPLPRNRYIIPPFSHPLDPRPDGRISQQPHRRPNEDEHDRLVLRRVSLEARRQDILLLLALAKAVAQAELAVAVVTCLFRGAGAQVGCGRLLGGGGVKGDDGAVAKTGAFAEGCWGWLGLVFIQRVRGVN